MHGLEGIGLPKISDASACFDDKGMMEVGSSGDVPGATDQGVCTETAYVMDEICDDDFNNLQGKPTGKGRVYDI